MIETIDSMQHLDNVLAANELVLLDFATERCGHCMAFAPIFEEYANKNAEMVASIKVDLDEHKDIAQRYNVLAVPALFIIKDGEIVENTLGAKSKEELQEWVGGFVS